MPYPLTHKTNTVSLLDLSPFYVDFIMNPVPTGKQYRLLPTLGSNSLT